MGRPMTTKTRKKRKSSADSSGIKVRKVRRPVVDDDGAQNSAAEEGESMAARIEKGVEGRLAKIETKIEKRTKSRAKSPGAKTRRRTGARPAKGPKAPAAKKKRAAAPAPAEAETRRPRLRKKSVVDRVLSLLPGARAADYEELIEKLEGMDEFGKGAELDGKLEAFMMFLYEKYWRVETSGLENIPNEGRALIVSNHSGVLPFDGAMMATAIYKLHPAERYARFLIEDWFGQLPFAMGFMNAVGQVRGCQENAQRLLRQEQLVGVFPEGINGMAKGFKDRYNVARFGRGGVIRLAIRTRSPVVPCAVVGAEEIYIVLGYANWLGKIFGMPLFPITATFPWLGPLGLIPLPTKWYIQFGEVISYDKYDDSALKDNVIINRLNRQLRTTVQEMVDSTLKKRRSLFF